jgi:hypothetical protein
MELVMENTALGRHAEKLYTALVDLGNGWHSRAEIARQLDRPRLTTYDGAALDLLITSGRIEAERHPIEGPIRERWEYRVKG